jgi:hypothetical protein
MRRVPTLEAAERARSLGLKRVTIAEFGVASGGGLLAMCQFARQATKETGVDFQIVGFDTCTGLPPPVDYRNHRDLFQHGDYPMPDHGRLKESPLGIYRADWPHEPTRVHRCRCRLLLVRKGRAQRAGARGPAKISATLAGVFR